MRSSWESDAYLTILQEVPNGKEQSPSSGSSWLSFSPVFRTPSTASSIALTTRGFSLVFHPTHKGFYPSLPTWSKLPTVSSTRWSTLSDWSDSRQASCSIFGIGSKAGTQWRQIWIRCKIFLFVSEWQNTFINQAKLRILATLYDCILIWYSGWKVIARVVFSRAAKFSTNIQLKNKHENQLWGQLKSFWYKQMKLDRLLCWWSWYEKEISEVGMQSKMVAVCILIWVGDIWNANLQIRYKSLSIFGWGFLSFGP